MELTDELLEMLPGGNTQEQAVIICLQFPIGKFQQKKALDAIFDLDAIFREVVEASGVGNYAGNEFCEGEGEESVTFYISGEDASRIYQEIKPILQSLSSLQEVSIIKHYSNSSKDQFPLRS
jgi:hypothetical protein